VASAVCTDGCVRVREKGTRRHLVVPVKKFM
jgi:hypothetical protein